MLMFVMWRRCIEMNFKEDKIYNVGYIQNFGESRRNVSAKNSKIAKEYFSKVFGGSIAYVVCKHHDSVSLNDCSHIIDDYDAKNGLWTKEMVLS
jgi:hypothetical protein